MIVTILALAVFAMGSGLDTDDAEQNPVLDLDPCVEVDDSAVQKLVDLELRGARAGDRDVPISVIVRCADGVEEIRVEPWASLGPDGIRPIELPAADAADPAAQEARSRELALAIAELIRRLEMTHPLHPKPPPPPPPPSPAIAVPAPPAADEARRRWQLAVSSSFEAFTGGQTMTGGDVSVAAPMGRWMVTELRAGGRLVDGATSPVAHLTGRAGTAAVAAGLNVWSQHRAVGFALMLRAQGYAIEYRIASPDHGDSRAALLGALAIVVEPRLLVAVSRRISLAAAAGAGVPLHGIVVRTQGAEANSVTGLAVSASLGASFSF